LIGAVPTGSAPVGVIVVNDGKQILVTNSNRFSTDMNARQMVTVIDASKVSAGSGAVMGTIPAGAFPREFALSPDKRTVFLTNFNSSELQVIDLSRMEIEPTRASPRRH
jgi:DNA-binding beta-propeller fold protein YncE